MRQIAFSWIFWTASVSTSVLIFKRFNQTTTWCPLISPSCKKQDHTLLLILAYTQIRAACSNFQVYHMSYKFNLILQAVPYGHNIYLYWTGCRIRTLSGLKISYKLFNIFFQCIHHLFLPQIFSLKYSGSWILFVYISVNVSVSIHFLLFIPWKTCRRVMNHW